MKLKIDVEVAYATPEKQEIIALQVDEGCSVFDAAVQSGIDKIFSEINFEKVDMGIFGKVVKKPSYELIRAGDRVEIYRPLLIDPKQARLNRVSKK